MNRGPKPGATRTDHLAKARACWGEDIPDWMVALAVDASRNGLAATAAKVGYGVSTVSQLISASYRGDLARVEEMVRGALMGATVDCPVLGQIGRDRCLQEQREPFRATSAMRAQLWHACWGGCPHASTGETP